MGNQIVPTNNNGNGKLAQFGDRDSIREMAERIQKMMPGTTNLNPTEALTVAQVAVAHGLDPFNGEVWGLKSETGKWYGVMVGIKGLRKNARIQAANEGGTYWTEPPARVDPKKYGQPENAVVYEIYLRDTVTMQAYGKSLKCLTDAGIPYAEAISMIGKAPVWVGVGIATADERSKMGIHARAKKRAEAEAIRQRYDVQFQGAQIADDDDEPDAPAGPSPLPEVEQPIEGQFTEQPAEQPKPRSEDQIMMDLYGKATA
jgi:hypothetical protein